jgi:hypothetical protein
MEEVVARRTRRARATPPPPRAFRYLTHNLAGSRRKKMGVLLKTQS